MEFHIEPVGDVRQMIDFRLGGLLPVIPASKEHGREGRDDNVERTVSGHEGVEFPFGEFVTSWAQPAHAPWRVTAAIPES